MRLLCKILFLLILACLSAFGWAASAGAFGGFVENRGQVDSRVKYYAPGSRAAVYFTEDALVIDLKEEVKNVQGRGPHQRPYEEMMMEAADSVVQRGCAVYVRFEGANPSPVVEARGEMETKYNYFIGNDPTRWRTEVPAYAEVVYRDVWPGVDLLFREDDGRLTYEVLLSPGADVERVQFRYEGADRVTAMVDGSVRIETPVGILAELMPWVGGRQWGGFAWAEFETSGDPQVTENPSALMWSTFLGGRSEDVGEAIVLDSSGDIVVTGYTRSSDFPTTPGAYDSTHSGGQDVFVAKLSASGSTLVWSTFLGGSSDDSGCALALDSSGNPIVVGSTYSSDLPMTPGGYDASFNGGVDVFVAKLSASGSALVWSTFLGGSSGDWGWALALDSSGSPVVTGYTGSRGFPTTPGAYDGVYDGYGDVFVAKLSASGNALVWSTFLGGSRYDVGYGLVLDSSGNTVVTGWTISSDFLTTPGAFDTSYNGGTYGDVFVAKISSSGSALLWSTFLGGSSDEHGNALVLDSSGNPVVAGVTYSSDFPTTPGGYDSTHNGGQDVFVVKLSASGSTLVWSTLLGGSSDEEGYDLVLDLSGNSVVTGETWSADFPTTAWAYDTSFNGSDYTDAFVAKLSASGNALVWSTFLGGSSYDCGYAVDLDSWGNPVVAGYTKSTDFPSTPEAYDQSNDGGYDAFVADLQVQPKIAISPDTVSQFTVNHIVNAKSVRISNLGGSDLNWTAGVSQTVRAGQAAMPRWLDVTPTSGVIPAGGYEDISVIMDARELEGGHYEGLVTLTSNDPTEPTVTVPVFFSVAVTLPVMYFDTDFNMAPVSADGRWVICNLGLPAGYDPHLADGGAVEFGAGQGTVLADSSSYEYEGPDSSGAYKLRVRFDRAAVEGILPEGMAVPIQVYGELDGGAYFVGQQIIDVIRPAMMSPEGGEQLEAGQNMLITWTVPSGLAPEDYALYFSPDGGATWQEIATGIAGQSLATNVPASVTNQGLFRVYACVGGKSVGYDTSDQPFTIVDRTSGTPGNLKPTSFRLDQNSPNPFRGSTAIGFDLPRDLRARLDIIDVGGRTVRTLVSGMLRADHYCLSWDGKSDSQTALAPGIYFVRMEAGSYRATKKVVMLR
ncbi:MAG: SBBP repeat-containing protein [Candidatus Eisenbacteria bacterium]